MQVQLNGQSREIPEGVTVGALLTLLGLPAGQVAVEVNSEVVTRAKHSVTVLQSGDTIEVVTFVGGG